MKNMKIIECPRDAMQGLSDFIPTETKANYINQLLKCGFDTIDFGSFVSPKAIPQMRDTAEVLSKLDLNSSTKLLAIIANERGAEDAVQFEEINYLGYPFSVSEMFQQRNTNASIEDSLKRVEAIQTLCGKNNKELVVYISMGFGNPYDELWSPEIVSYWSDRLYKEMEIKILALSDTIGCATVETVEQLFKQLIDGLPQVEFGAHMHVKPEQASAIVQAAYENGCRRFDGAINGFGGCPMAKDDLTGNMPTERMLDWFNENGISSGIDAVEFNKAQSLALSIFPH
jgi:hydroxymethylglutaryl-CoA lyase